MFEKKELSVSVIKKESSDSIVPLLVSNSYQTLILPVPYNLVDSVRIFIEHIAKSPTNMVDYFLIDYDGDDDYLELIVIDSILTPRLTLSGGIENNFLPSSLELYHPEDLTVRLLGLNNSVDFIAIDLKDFNHSTMSLKEIVQSLIWKSGILGIDSQDFLTQFLRIKNGRIEIPYLTHEQTCSTLKDFWNWK